MNILKVIRTYFKIIIKVNFMFYEFYIKTKKIPSKYFQNSKDVFKMITKSIQDLLTSGLYYTSLVLLIFKTLCNKILQACRKMHRISTTQS